MTISLPLEKKEKITKLHKRFSVPNKKFKIREFAKFLGTLTAACPAILYRWLYTKSFERIKFLDLLKPYGNYNSTISIPPNLLKEFQWWSTNINSAKKFIKPLSFKIENFSDVPTTGWGVYCGGKTSHGFGPSQRSLIILIIWNC
jgi:hypothetical protein